MPHLTKTLLKILERESFLHQQLIDSRREKQRKFLLENSNKNNLKVTESFKITYAIIYSIKRFISIKYCNTLQKTQLDHHLFEYRLI